MVKWDLEKLLKHYGIKDQCLQTEEELHELGIAVSKSMRHPMSPEYRDNLREEMADVLVTCSQLCIHWGISRKSIEDLADEKIARQISRIRGEERKNAEDRVQQDR